MGRHVAAATQNQALNAQPSGIREDRNIQARYRQGMLLTSPLPGGYWPPACLHRVENPLRNMCLYAANQMNHRPALPPLEKKKRSMQVRIESPSPDTQRYATSCTSRHLG